MTVTADLAAVYNRDAVAMRRHILHRTGNARLAQDLTHEVFVKVLRAVQAGRAVDNLRAYTWRALRNTLIDHKQLLSSQATHVPLYYADASPKRSRDPADAIHTADYVERLIAASGIGEKQMTCLLASYFDNLAAEEIAEAIGITPGAVKVRIARALARLREIAAEVEGDPEIVNARAHMRRKITDKLIT